MRSTEFITERSPGTMDGDIGAPATPVQSAQADAARIAQGQKNLNALKGFFGAKPEELKDAPPGTPIDPYVRARMGYKPATQKEIADFQAANPNYGKVVGRDGQPIKSGTPGVTWDAGGEKAVAQTAQAAAPMRKGDVHAGQQGYNTDLERIPGAGIRGQKGYDYQPAPVAPAAPAPVAPAPVAPAPAPVQSAEPTPSFNVPGAAQAGQGGYNYTTGVEQDRPHRPDAGADETTRNDYPFAPPGADKVKPVQSPLPRPKTTTTTDPNQRIKRQSGGARRPWGTVKDKDGRQVYIDNDGGKWVWPPNSTAWQPANLTPGSDYIDKALPTTTGYTPPGQGATPATGPVSTGRQPWEHTPPAAEPVQAATPVPAAINRGTNTKYKNPPGEGATPVAAAGSSIVVKPGDTLSKIAAANGTTVQAIMAANPNIKDANKIAAGQTVKLSESSEVARIRHLAGLTKD